MNENWVIDLLIGDGDVQNYNKFSLVYVAGSQERYKLEQSGGIGNAVTGSISGQAPIVIQHVSDNEAPEPSRLTEANKQGAWRISVFDDENDTPEWDTILNNVHAINRHFSGATSTAARHSVDGSAEKVRIAIKPEGATNTTYFDVRYGHADVSQCYYTAASQQTDGTNTKRGAWFIPINLVFTEAGYGDSFTLRNDLPSSPHMIEDSNGDGLADGWSLYGSPSALLNTSSFLTGGQAQVFITDSTSSEGIESSLIACSAGTDVVSSVWVTATSDKDPLLIAIIDGGGATLSSATFDPSLPAGYDKTTIGVSGLVWYRYSLTGTTGTVNTKLRMFRASGVATVNSSYIVDNAYLQIDATVIPDAFCSSSSLKNRYDPASTSAATQQQINYLDVWGVPGDLPALVNNQIVATNFPTSDNAVLLVGKEIEGLTNLATNTYNYEGELFLTPSGWSRVTDATRSSGEYLRNSNTGSTSATTSALAVGKSNLLENEYRVYAVARTSDASGEIALNVEGQDVGKSVFNAINTWEMIDLGLLNMVGVLSPVSKISVSVSFILEATATVAANIDIDVIYFIPTDDFLVYKQDGTVVANLNIYLEGKEDKYYNSRNYINTPVGGGMRYATPKVANRYIFSVYAADGVSDLGSAFSTYLTVTPRASHLLGTQ